MPLPPAVTTPPAEPTPSTTGARRGFRTHEFVVDVSRAALSAYTHRTGGVRSAPDMAEYLGVDLATLATWHSDGRVLALRDRDGSRWFPVAQCEPATRRGPRATWARPYPALATLLDVLRPHFSAEEIFGLFATPQPILYDADEEPRTVFQVLADGQGNAAIAFARWVCEPRREGVPARARVGARGTRGGGAADTAHAAYAPP